MINITLLWLTDDYNGQSVLWLQMKEDCSLARELGQNVMFDQRAQWYIWELNNFINVQQKLSRYLANGLLGYHHVVSLMTVKHMPRVVRNMRRESAPLTQYKAEGKWAELFNRISLGDSHTHRLVSWKTLNSAHNFPIARSDTRPRAQDPRAVSLMIEDGQVAFPTGICDETYGGIWVNTYIYHPLEEKLDLEMQWEYNAKKPLSTS